jgi:hypothetical protein
MVFELTRIEVLRETAPRARRNSLDAQHCREQARVVVATACQSIGFRPRLAERPRIQGEHGIEHSVHTAQVDVLLSHFGKRHVVEVGGNNVVCEQALDDANQCSDFRGQRRELRRMRAWRCQRSEFGVVLEQHGFRHGIDLFAVRCWRSAGRKCSQREAEVASFGHADLVLRRSDDPR